MNRMMDEHYPVFRLYQALRNQMMDLLVDVDLTFRLGGNNDTLGHLCREIGEVQHCYIQSFQTFEMDFSYRVDQPDLEKSVRRLVAWFKELDLELESAVANLSQEDIENRKIDRGGDFILSPQIQLEVYKEALLIFYGKASVYLKALQKELPDQWKHWIA